VTYGDLIRASLEEIGVVAGGQAMKTVDSDKALNTLIDLIDSWNAERLSVGTQTESTFALTSGVQTYAIGVGAAAPFNVARPEWIDSGAFIRSTDPTPLEYNHQAPLTDAEWADIRMKTLTDSLTRVFRYLDSFPNGQIDVWPVPNVSTLSIKLYYPTALTIPATIATVLSLRPGYRRALRTNLSVELAAGPFARPIKKELAQMAIDSKATLQRRNLKGGTMKPDPCMAMTRGGGRFNILTNTYGSR
jgi:hypothetical protein